MLLAFSKFFDAVVSMRCSFYVDVPIRVSVLSFYCILCCCLFGANMSSDDNPVVGSRLKMLRQPKMFSGLAGESATEWLSEYTMIFDSAGVSKIDQAKYFPLYLSGTALLWYRSVGTDDKGKLDKLIEKMEANFSPRESSETIQRDLWQRIFLPRERMIDYVYAKLELCRLSDPAMSSVDKIKWVSRGLPSFYRERVRGLENKSIDEFTKELLELELFCPQETLLCAVGTDRNEMKGLLREAFEEFGNLGKKSSQDRVAEEKHYRNRFESEPTRYSGASSRSNYERPKSRESDRYDQKQFESGRARSRFGGQCWRCGISGHTRRDCRVNLRNRDLNEDRVGMRGDTNSEAVFHRGNRR